MLFSIIVPVYNNQDYLRECIESIVSQIVDFEEGAELILVDDGSNDRSGKICDEYQERYSNIIRVYHRENEGSFLARRFGYEKARGEYILSCDSDDICVRTQVSELKNIIKETHADVIFFNMDLLKTHGIKDVFFENIFGNQLLTLVDKKDVLKDYMTSYKTISMCCKAFRKNCLNLEYDYGIYGKLNYCDDTIQSAELYTAAQSFVYYNKSLYNYRIGSGMTGKYQEDFYHQHKEMYNCIKRYFKQWDMDNIECLMALRVFSMVGRAITQSRLNKSMTYIKRKKYLEEIRRDSLILDYEQYYKQIRRNLQKSYRVLCTLFLYKRYGMIDFLLKVKNLVEL